MQQLKVLLPSIAGGRGHVNMQKDMLWLTKETAQIYKCNSCLFLIGWKLQECLWLAKKSANEREIGVMLLKLNHQYLQSWLAFWHVNIWLLPPAIEGSKTFSYCAETWLWRGLWPEFFAWRGCFSSVRVLGHLYGGMFQCLNVWICSSRLNSSMFNCWIICIEDCSNIWILESSRC